MARSWTGGTFSPDPFPFPLVSCPWDSAFFPCPFPCLFSHPFFGGEGGRGGVPWGRRGFRGVGDIGLRSRGDGVWTHRWDPRDWIGCRTSGPSSPRFCGVLGAWATQFTVLFSEPCPFPVKFFFYGPERPM